MSINQQYILLRGIPPVYNSGHQAADSCRTSTSQ